MIVAAFIALSLFGAQQASPTAPAASPAPASPAAPAAAAVAAVPAAATDPANEQVCRRQPIQGSRRSERVCHTRAQWDMIREHARGNRDQVSQSQRE